MAFGGVSLIFNKITQKHRRQRRRGCRGRDPPIFDLQVSSCVDDPQYFDKCFISGTSIKFIIQLQSMGHMNLKNNTSF